MEYAYSNEILSAISALVIALPAMVDEKSHVAEVIHRYEPTPLSVEKAAAKKAEAERREAEAKRKEAAKRAASRLANRGAARLRKERTKLERARRLEKEMELAERRGQRVERELVLRQAAFLLTALRFDFRTFSDTRYTNNCANTAKA